MENCKEKTEIDKKEDISITQMMQKNIEESRKLRYEECFDRDDDDYSDVDEFDGMD